MPSYNKGSEEFEESIELLKNTDLTKGELEEIVSNCTEVNIEYNECLGNDVNSFNERSFFNGDDECICIVNDYPCTGGVDLIETL